LIDNVDFWFALLDETDKKIDIKVYEILKDNLSPTVLNNKELMLRLIAYDVWNYLTIISVDSSLKADAEIVENVLELDPTMLDAIDGPVQLQNPRLVGMALAHLPLWYEASSNFFKDCVDINAWRNRDVVLGWVNGGGELHDQIPQSLREDQEILLSMDSKKPTLFQTPTAMPDGLCSNIEFMKKAVEKNPLMLNSVAENLRGNKDLALAALSGTHGSLIVRLFSPGFFPDEEGTITTRSHRCWLQVGEWVRQQLRTHDAFVKLIMGSINFSDSKPSNLAVMDHGGEETVLARMKLIAEYAGVPIGEKLTKLRVARKNLAKGGVCWSD